MVFKITTGTPLPTAVLTGLALLGMTTSGMSVADVYRCTRPDGKMEYQQQPCTGSTQQKTIDDSQSRKRKEAEEQRKQFEQRMAERRAESEAAVTKRVEDKKSDAKKLAFCVSKEVECTEASYQVGLHCMSRNEVEGILGAPTQSQNIGGQKFIYYTVPIHNGTAFVARKIQLVIGFCNDIPGPNQMNRVTEVNIY